MIIFKQYRHFDRNVSWCYDCYDNKQFTVNASVVLHEILHPFVHSLYLKIAVTSFKARFVLVALYYITYFAVQFAVQRKNKFILWPKFYNYMKFSLGYCIDCDHSNFYQWLSLYRHYHYRQHTDIIRQSIDFSEMNSMKIEIASLADKIIHNFFGGIY